jgi:hypothetical protein
MGEGAQSPDPENNENNEPIDHNGAPSAPPTKHKPPDSDPEKTRGCYKIARDIVGLVGVIAAVLAAYYYSGELREMQKQTTIQRNSSMLAEDAWLHVSSGNVKYSTNSNGMTSVITTVHITNTGKTPARQIYAEVAMRLVPNDVTCVPDYRGNQLSNAAGNLMLPGGEPISFVVRLGEDTGQHEKPKLISKAAVAQWKAGQYFVVTYGRLTYRDIFGGWHWEHFCSYSPSDHVPQSPWCEAYNNMDTRRLGRQPRRTPPVGEPYVAAGHVHPVPVEPASVPFCNRITSASSGLFAPIPPGAMDSQVIGMRH